MGTYVTRTTNTLAGPVRARMTETQSARQAGRTVVGSRSGGRGVSGALAVPRNANGEVNMRAIRSANTRRRRRGG